MPLNFSLASLLQKEKEENEGRKIEGGERRRKGRKRKGSKWRRREGKEVGMKREREGECLLTARQTPITLISASPQRKEKPFTLR